MVEVRTEQFDLNRPRRAGEIVDDVRQDLHEIDLQSRDRGGDLSAHFVDYFEDRPRSLALWLEARDDVALVLLCRKKAQLRSRSSRRRRYFSGIRKYALYDVQLSVGLGESRTTRSEVIKHECALVHLRKKPGADKTLSGNAGDDQDAAGNQHAAWMMKHAFERVLITRRQRV